MIDCTNIRKFSVLILVGVALWRAQTSYAQTVITDYLSMESGNNGEVVTPPIASLASVGTSGVWANATDRPALSANSQLKVSTRYVRPPRGDIKVGNVTLPNSPSAKNYVKKVTLESDQEAIEYFFKSPRPNKVSLGMFLQFSSDGDGWKGTTWRYYDLFALTGSAGINYLVLSVQTRGGNDGTPIVLTIHTDVKPCNSGVEVAQVSQNKWYWVSMLYDYSGTKRLASMEVYDATTWEKLGANECLLPNVDLGSQGAWRASVGQIDNHNTPTQNSDFYMDDLMIDTKGSWPLVPKPGVSVVEPVPAAPGEVRVSE